MNKTFMLPALTVAAALFVVARPAEAQVELGMDAAFSTTSFSAPDGFDVPSATTIALPAQRVRAGFQLSPAMSFEPSFGFSRLDVGDDAITQMALGTDLLYHFGDNPNEARLYVAAGPSLALVDVGSESATQFSLGGDVGVKVPVADQMGVRFGVGYTRGFETDSQLSSNTFSVLAGFSFWTE